MEYGKFIDELISLLTSWGTWKEPIEIVYDGKIYAAG